jgi:hypothetical protein
MESSWGITAAQLLVAYRVVSTNAHQDQSQGPTNRVSSALICVVWACPVFPTCKGYLLIDWDQEALACDHMVWGQRQLGNFMEKPISVHRYKKNSFESHLIRRKQYNYVRA